MLTRLQMAKNSPKRYWQELTRTPHYGRDDLRMGRRSSQGTVLGLWVIPRFPQEEYLCPRHPDPCLLA